MQVEIVKAQKFEAIGTLTHGIAHDFNNLLSIIMGYISLAEEDIKPEVGGSEYLKEAEKASLRAQELTNQLISFSKGGVPVKKVGSLGNLIKETTDFFLSESKVAFEFSFLPDRWPVEFDEDHMQHVIKSLIVNAVESMPDGGTIDVRAENINVGSGTEVPNLLLSDGKYVKISIRDQGIGIPKEHLSKIFDPYFSTKEIGTQKGMGLGLATAYSIIKKHSGCIAVESEVGIGTTFTLYLPALEKTTPDLEPAPKPDPEKPVPLTGRILVMDDEEMIRNISQHMLRRRGYKPEVAKDGAEAIECYQGAMDSGKPFDAVILDLTVKGGIGGKEAVKTLLKINPQVKAVVSSGYSNHPEMTDFKTYGFTGVLTKPYKMKDLADVLNTVITGKR